MRTSGGSVVSELCVQFGSFQVIFSPLGLIRQDFMCSLYGLEFAVEFLLFPRIAVGVIFESYGMSECDVACQL